MLHIIAFGTFAYVFSVVCALMVQASLCDPGDYFWDTKWAMFWPIVPFLIIWKRISPSGAEERRLKKKLAMIERDAEILALRVIIEQKEKDYRKYLERYLDSP